ncbi:hypothetical protein [Streptomyces sp. NPDC005423]|uniref:hypothetical protein n=1 Tax=Streptomyces sp. NPDC005423 TaxID=3155343 RepID=UPI0033BBF418
MQTQPESPRPPGAPRWVAMAYRPSSSSWQVCAESPYRAPVQYALGEMAHTVRARGDDLTVTLWGPRDGVWQRYAAPGPAAPEAPPASGPAPGEGAAGAERSAGAAGSVASAGPSVLAERMSDRRQQVLRAGLSKAGLHDLTPDDWAAVETLAERLDETTARTVARWLGAAGREQG